MAIDYFAEAKKMGGTPVAQTKSSSSGGIDYAAEAAKMGGTSGNPGLQNPSAYHSDSPLSNPNIAGFIQNQADGTQFGQSNPKGPGANLPKPWEAGAAESFKNSPVGHFLGDVKNSLYQGANTLVTGLNEAGQAGQMLADKMGAKPMEGDIYNNPQGNNQPLTGAAIGKKLLRGTGDVLGGGVQAGFAPQSAAIEALPDIVKTPIKEVLNIPAHITGAATETIGKLMGVDTSTPDFQQNFVQPMQNIVNAYLAANPEAVSKVAKGVTEVAGKGIEMTGNAIKGTGDLVSNVAGKTKDFALNQATGLNPETIKTIVANPELLGEAQKVGIEGSREMVKKMVQNPIDQKISDLSDTGKAYQPIRESGQIVNLPQDYLKIKLQDAGLNIDEAGQITGTSKSSVRKAGDISKIQEIYDRYNKPQLGADEFLNMREDLKDLAKYESGKTTQVQDFARGLRNEVNTDLRPQVNGLETLDNKYASTIQDLKKVKNLIYDKNGLKDNAVSVVNNLFNKGKEGILPKLQEALPDFDMEKFTKQVKVTKALEDIEAAKGQKVGSYARSILGAGGIATMNIPAMVTAIITQPDVIVSLLKRYGKLKEMNPDIVDSISNKIQQGIKPSGTEFKFVQEAFKKTSPAVLKTFMQGSLSMPKQQVT